MQQKKPLVIVGADHGGFELKEKLKAFLQQHGYHVLDEGNTANEPSDDYPDFAIKVAEKVARGKNAMGILMCRSAAGMVIAANKVKGVRAVAAFDVKSAEHSRQHNDANVLALSGDWMNEEQAKPVLIAWLETPFSGEERHARRLRKIAEYEKRS